MCFLIITSIASKYFLFYCSLLHIEIEDLNNNCRSVHSTIPDKTSTTIAKFVNKTQVSKHPPPFPLPPPACETNLFAIFLITIDAQRQKDDILQNVPTNYKHGHSWPSATFHSRAIFSPINSQNQGKSAKINNKSILLNIITIQFWQFLSLKPRKLKIFRSDCLITLLRLAAMVANLKVNFIFCRYRSSI